ncbi:phenylalanine--tRNA ligase subunit beta [Sulfuriferula thiophila]|uniref:phenylalanine--tRNA ligase subunit beta n=1 Tax=Sulfuriferula thiophila TaxID=1781211 RepID=UPI000F604B23|nr:phenylalanine--tRNA ligase subunit beta [Sulfuriferula thiophila]
MKFSELWLRSYVNPPMDSAALSHLLTMAGLEVEEMAPVAADFNGIVVGHVVSVAPHPDADRLRVCVVDAGTGAHLQIVCGAANVSAGVRVPCAMVGAKLPGFEIKKAKLRGVESLGMLCSARELGMAEEADGLLLLPDDAPIGQDIRDYLRLNDHVLTLKLTPNRSDCLSVMGIAREVAALTGSELMAPEVAVAPVVTSVVPDIRVAATEACPRYCGQIISGLNPQAVTPDWMAERLLRSGLRSLGAVVDITNYVMLETGQPLHAFDLAKVSGAIDVRMAQAGESLVLLNEQTVRLDDDMLVIADQSGVLALAGIMGGIASGVSDGTTEILLESAFFHPDYIAGRARRLGLSTDASHRFERGVDFAATQNALARAAQLIVEICGGNASAVTEVLHELPVRAAIRLRPARVSKVLGIPFSHADVGQWLQRLQFEFAEDGDAYRVTPPSYRFDLTIEVDLIEELARLFGYDNIPPIAPVANLNMLPQSEQQRPIDRLRDILVVRDYQEVITYSFVDAAWEAALAPGIQPVLLKNPIASQMSVMRSTLWGGLIDVLKTNLNRRQTRVRIMEVGSCFLSAGHGYAQPLRIAGLAFGDVAPEQWGMPARVVDYYDVKADLEALCWPQVLTFRADAHAAMHPGQCASVSLNGVDIGWLGALHPALVQQWDLPSAPVMFELALDALLLRDLPKHGEISRFQGVRRDLAVIVSQEVAAQALLDAMHSARIAGIAEIALFDVYRGKGIDSDKKSLAFRVLMQDNQKTFTDSEVDAVMAQLTELLQQKFNAQLRS